MKSGDGIGPETTQNEFRNSPGYFLTHQTDQLKPTNDEVFQLHMKVEQYHRKTPSKC